MITIHNGALSNWSEKNYLGPLGAPCLERRLRIRVELTTFPMNSGSLKELSMATLTADELEYVIRGCQEYKHG